MARRRGFPIDRLMVDVAFTLMALFAALFALTAQTQKAAEAAIPIGDLTVNAQWDPGVDVDVDLWVKGPGDDEPVGWRHRADKQSSFLRDDVGMTNDFTPLNYEVVGIRGLLPGRYVVNLHLFNSRGVPSTHVWVTVTQNIGSNGVTVKLAARELDLTVNHAETTVFSFALDDIGDMVDGSLLLTPVPLITAAPEGDSF